MLRDSIQTSNKYFKVLYGPLDHVFYITLHNRPYKNLVLFDDNFRQIRKIDVSHVSSFQSRCIHSQSTINVRNSKQSNKVTKYLLEIYFGSTNRNPLTFTTVSYKDCQILCSEIERTFGVRVYSYGSLNSAFKNALKNASEDEVITENYDEYRIKNEKYHLYKLVLLESDENNEPVSEISSNFPVVIEGNMENGSFLSYRDIRSKNNLNSSVYKVEWYLSKSFGSNDEFFEIPSETSDTFYLSEYMVGHYVMVKVYRALKFNENRTFVYSIAQRGPIYPNTLLCHHILINCSKKSDFHDVLISTLDLDVLFNVVDAKNKFGVYQPFNAPEVINNFAYFQNFIKTTNNDILKENKKTTKNKNIKNNNNDVEDTPKTNADYNNNNNNQNIKKEQNAVIDAKNGNTQNSENDNVQDSEEDSTFNNNDNTNKNNINYEDNENNDNIKKENEDNDKNDQVEEEFFDSISQDPLSDSNIQTITHKYNNIKLKVPSKGCNNQYDLNKDENNESDIDEDHKDDREKTDENNNEYESEENKNNIEFLYRKKTMKYYDENQKDLHDATTVSDFSESDNVNTFGVDEYFREDNKRKKFSIFNIFKSDKKKRASKMMNTQPKFIKKTNNNINDNNQDNNNNNVYKEIKEVELQNTRKIKDSILLAKERRKQIKNNKINNKTKNIEDKNNNNKSITNNRNNNNNSNDNSPIINKIHDMDSSVQDENIDEDDPFQIQDGLDRLKIRHVHNAEKPVKRRIIKDSLLLIKEKAKIGLFNKKVNENEQSNGILNVYVQNTNNNDKFNDDLISNNINNKNNKGNKQKGKKIIFNRKYEKQYKLKKANVKIYNSLSSNFDVDTSRLEHDNIENKNNNNSNNNINEYNKDKHNNKNKHLHFQNKRKIKDSMFQPKQNSQKLENNDNNNNENIKNNNNKHSNKSKKVIMDRKYEKQIMKNNRENNNNDRNNSPTNKTKGGLLGFLSKITSPKSNLEKLYPKNKNDMVVYKSKEEINLEKFKKYIDTIQFVPVKLRICLNEIVMTFGLCSLSLKWKLIEPEKPDMLSSEQFPSIQKQLDSNLILVYNSVIPIRITMRTQSTFQRNVLYHSIIFNKYRTNYSIDRCERELESCYYNGVRRAYVKLCKTLYETKKRNDDQNKNIEQAVNCQLNAV